jgi:hypothetical protein
MVIKYKENLRTHAKQNHWVINVMNKYKMPIYIFNN